MNYFEIIPNEMLEKIICQLLPETLSILVQTCKYNYNNNFYYKYIKYNFNCLYYNIKEWKLDSFKHFSDKQKTYNNWTEIFKLLTQGKYILSKGIYVSLNDTYNTIKQKISFKHNIPISNFSLMIRGMIYTIDDNLDNFYLLENEILENINLQKYNKIILSACWELYNSINDNGIITFKNSTGGSEIIFDKEKNTIYRLGFRLCGLNIINSDFKIIIVNNQCS